MSPVWQPRHRVLFERLVQEYPFGCTRGHLRSVFDRTFPHFSGYSFAGAMRALENAGLIETCDGCPWIWATSPAMHGWHLRKTPAWL